MAFGLYAEAGEGCHSAFSWAVSWWDLLVVGKSLPAALSGGGRSWAWQGDVPGEASLVTGQEGVRRQLRK